MTTATVTARHRDLGLDFAYRCHDEPATLRTTLPYQEQPGLVRPQPFKVYTGTARYPLADDLPSAIGDARASFGGHGLEPSTPFELDPLTLSTLLYFAYGYSREDVGRDVSYRYHRFVPSARCLFPTELYLWVPRVGDIPAGVYHYDNLHHSLELLRPGPHLSVLGRLLGTDLAGAGAVLLISSLFWKTSFRYSDFAYRLCCQEAGMVAGNALMVAGALGWRGRIHWQFLDRVVNRLLRLETGEESVFAAIPLFPATTAHEERPHQPVQTCAEEDLLDEVPALSVPPSNIEPMTSRWCPVITAVDAAASLSSTDDFARWEREWPLCDSQRGGAQAPPPDRRPFDLAAALYARSSGDVFLAPAPAPMGHDAFWDIFGDALSGVESDVMAGAALPLDLYVVANRVEGIPSGVHRVCSDCRAVHEVRRGDMSLSLQRIYIQPAVNCASACLACFVVTDFEAGARRFGVRAYRILTMMGGVVAQRICTLSGASGFVARCSDAYDTAGCREVLGLTPASTPIFQMVLGREAPGATSGDRYQLDIRL